MADLKQVMSEWLEFRGIANPSKWILEIGTFRGQSAISLKSVAENVISIDMDDRRINKTKMYKFVKANSHDPKTVERIEHMLGGDMLDTLFIDGDHSYDGVKCDFNLYKHLVKPGGVIALHDIVDSEKHRRKKCDVYRFWDEIKSQYKYKEIIHDGSWGGIGVVWL